MNEKLELKLDVPSVNSVTRWLEYLSNSLSPKHIIYALSIYIWIVSCGKGENKQKEVGIGPFKKSQWLKSNRGSLILEEPAQTIVPKSKTRKKSGKANFFYCVKFDWKEWWYT